MKMCKRCGLNPVRPAKHAGTMLCQPCIDSSDRHERGAKGHIRKSKKPACEHCGFVALHPCQLDIDHIDGNRDNNDSSNLQTLCANCHRLKTIISTGRPIRTQNQHLTRNSVSFPK